MRFAHLFTTLVRPTTPIADDLTCFETTRTSIAYEWREGTVQLGVSFCSPVDRFDRKIGRHVAEGRMQAPHRRVTIDVPEEVTTQGQMLDFLCVWLEENYHTLSYSPEKWLTASFSQHGFDRTAAFSVGEEVAV